MGTYSKDMAGVLRGIKGLKKLEIESYLASRTSWPFEGKW